MSQKDYLFNELLEKENSLEKYNEFIASMSNDLSIDFFAETLLKKKKKIRVMDLGCGNAGALRELKKKLGNEVFAIGIDLVEFSSEKIDQKLIGNALEIQFPNEIDFLFSFRSVHLIGNIPFLMEKICESLSVGGISFLSIRVTDVSGYDFAGAMTQIDLDFLAQIIAEKNFAGCEIKGQKLTAVMENAVEQGGMLQKYRNEIVLGINLLIKKVKK